jgi:hypothetical protein
MRLLSRRHACCVLLRKDSAPTAFRESGGTPPMPPVRGALPLWTPRRLVLLEHGDLGLNPAAPCEAPPALVTPRQVRNYRAPNAASLTAALRKTRGMAAGGFAYTHEQSASAEGHSFHQAFGAVTRAGFWPVSKQGCASLLAMRVHATKDAGLEPTLSGRLRCSGRGRPCRSAEGRSPLCRGLRGVPQPPSRPLSRRSPCASPIPEQRSGAHRLFPYEALF